MGADTAWIISNVLQLNFISRLRNRCTSKWCNGSDETSSFCVNQPSADRCRLIDPTIAWYWLDSTEVPRWDSACQSIETRSSMDGGKLVNGSTRARQWIDGRASMDGPTPVNGWNNARQWMEQYAPIKARRVGRLAVGKLGRPKTPRGSQRCRFSAAFLPHSDSSMMASHGYFSPCARGNAPSARHQSPPSPSESYRILRIGITGTGLPSTAAL